MFAQIDGLTIHYRLEGKTGKPVLVFINSLGTDFRIWDEVCCYFLSDYQVLRYDKRGHGLSDAPNGEYSLKDHSHDLKGLLEHLKLENVTLTGISVGGMIAQDFALRFPQVVNALVLSDTGAKIGNADFWNARIERIQKEGLAEVAKTVIGRWFAPTYAKKFPASYQGYYHMLARTSEAGYLGTCASLKDADLRSAIANICVPTLILCGAEDASTPPTLSQEMRDSIKGSRLELIPNAGHLPCIEQPTLMAEKIAEFLKVHHG